MGPAGQALPYWEPIAPADPDLTTYTDRTLRPEDTVAAVWPYLGQLGITRVARQTGLDRVGIPTWAAFRPNSKSLAGAQGKGLTDAAACASAVMEAAEVAVAESPFAEEIVATAASLSSSRVNWYNPDRLLRIGRPFDPDTPLAWLSGRDLAGAGILIPRDAVDMDGETCTLPGICKTSHGLASGNTADEALFHALCELVERDGTTLWSLLSHEQAMQTCIAPEDFGDDAIVHLAGIIGEAGLRLSLFDQTTELGIPVIMAVIGPTASDADELEMAAGYGAHPVASRAALRAITEAAQSRVTSIAASRDDIARNSFKAQAAPRNLQLLDALARRGPPAGHPVASLSTMLDRMQLAIANASCRVATVSIASPDLPFHVVKALSPDLEDRSANINWRPGWRCFDFLAAAA